MNTDQKLQEDILNCLILAKGSESISFLMESLRGKGWKGLGRISRFEETLERLGFTLVRIRAANSSNIRQTNVTI